MGRRHCGIRKPPVALLSAYVATRAQRQAQDLETFRTDATRDLELLKIERDERAEREKRELDAEAVLSHYREPLVAAAYDLQARLYNIVHNGLLEIYARQDSERRDEAIMSTLFRLAQYFGWNEILRQDISSWKFSEDADTREVGARLQVIQQSFRSDNYDHQEFMLWSDEQRGIGELMIVQDGNAKTCIGYARFIEIYSKGLARWLSRYERNLGNEIGPDDERLSDIQNHLCRLVIQLDPKELRYDHSTMEKGYLSSSN